MKRISWMAPALPLFMALVVLLGAMAKAEDPRKIMPAELNTKLGKPNVIILDVRSAPDWEGSDKKIRGAVHEDPRNVQLWAGKYSQKKTLVLYCA